MIDLLFSVLGSSASAEVVTAAASALCLLLVVLFVDIIKDIFCGFFRG